MPLEDADVEDSSRFPCLWGRGGAEGSWEAAVDAHGCCGGGAAGGEVVAVCWWGVGGVFQCRTLVGGDRALRGRVWDCVLVLSKRRADDRAIRSESGCGKGDGFDCQRKGSQRRRCRRLGFRGVIGWLLQNWCGGRVGRVGCEWCRAFGRHCCWVWGALLVKRWREEEDIEI